MFIRRFSRLGRVPAAPPGPATSRAFTATATALKLFYPPEPGTGLGSLELVYTKQ